MESYEITGTWQLNKIERVSMDGSNSFEGVDFNEFYEFFSDGTFIKERANEWVINGVYTYHIIDKDTSGLLLEFENVENSYSKQKEVYLKRIDNSILKEDYSAIDRDIYFYKKVQ